MVDQEDVPRVLGDRSPDLLLDLLVLEDEALGLGVALVEQALVWKICGSDWRIRASYPNTTMSIRKVLC